MGIPDGETMRFWRNFLLALPLFGFEACWDEMKDTAAFVPVGDPPSPLVFDSGLLDTGLEEGCQIVVTGTYPVHESDQFYHREPIKVALSGPDETAEIEIRGPDGAVPGLFTNEDGLMTFQAEPPLAPLSEYTAFVSFCGGEGGESILFNTNALGTPVQVEDLTEYAYALDFHNGTWESPRGLGPMIADLMDNFLLFGISHDFGDRFDVLVTSSVPSDIVQDFCIPSLNEIPTVDASASPLFSIPNMDLRFSSNGYNFNLTDFKMDGVLAPDGNAIAYGTISANLDMRDMSVLVNMLPEDICNVFLPNFGEECVPCEDGASYCTPLLVTHVHAANTGKPVQCVDEYGCHPECGNNDPFFCPHPHETGYCE
jgi:hypothetical protein